MAIWSNTGDKLVPTFYRVIIDTSNAANYPVTTSDGGAVSPNSPEALVAAGGTIGTNAQLLVKVQANLRWARILEELNKQTQAHILNVNVTGETNTSDTPTAIGFTVYYEQDEFNRVIDIDDGVTVLTGANAITQMVAFAMATDITVKKDVPTAVGGVFTGSAYQDIALTSVQTRLATEGDITVETSGSAGSGIEETAQ